MSLEVVKLVGAVAIFVVGFIGALVARRMTEQPGDGSALSIANCLAGGIFIAAGLIHVLPDSQSQLAVAFPSISYPLFGLLATASFALMLLIDQVGHQASAKEQNSVVSAAVLFLVLSIHSIITGFALGIENQSVAAVALLIAVLAHKGTASFALALKVSPVSEKARQFLGRMIAFSLTTPVGVLLGLWLLNQLSGSKGPMMEGLFDALAAGTFLYVAIFEILSQEFRKHGHVNAKLVAMILGATLMAVVALWT